MILNPSRQKNIAIFDSGIGGTTILSEVRQKLPAANLYYICDNKNFPYGTKSQQEVLECCLNSVHSLVKRVDIDVLVVACNTASTIALEALRSEFNCEVVGVVPAIKPAAEQSKTGSIALLATNATIKRAYTHNLINEYASNVEVQLVGCSEFVPLAEDLFNSELSEGQKQVIYQKMLPINNTQVDCLVLGCTHFNLLLPLMQQALTRNVLWIDSAPAIARRVASLVGGSAGSSSLSFTGQGLCFSTSEMAWSQQAKKYFFSVGINRYEQLS